jgi:hypothetical protein
MIFSHENLLSSYKNSSLNSNEKKDMEKNILLSEEKECTNKQYHELDTLKTNKNTERAKTLQQEILNYFNQNKYHLISDITTVTAKNNSLHYTCNCGEEKNKSYKDILLKGCRGCKNLNLKEKPSEHNKNYPTDDPDEKWAPTEGGFISSKGRACNVYGKILSMDEKGRYFLAGKSQYISILMARAFQLQGVENLKGQKSNAIVRVKEKGNFTLDNIYIGTRNEIGEINGKLSRQSEEFKSNMSKSLFNHIEKFKYKTIPELPNHKIFEDGSIYNDKPGSGGKRFLTFSKCSSNEDKEYLTICLEDKSYKLHRLVCYTFHPIQGLNRFEDYDPKIYQVNHKDGNTLNNHKDNLEWVTKEQNMQHAYDNKLNKKVRPVMQFTLNSDKTKGEFIAEYVSLAKAAKELNIPEHQIREPAKGKRPQKNFFWCYKYEDDNEEWSKKFSSKV